MGRREYSELLKSAKHLEDISIPNRTVDTKLKT